MTYSMLEAQHLLVRDGISLGNNRNQIDSVVELLHALDVQLLQSDPPEPSIHDASLLRHTALTSDLLAG